MSTMKRFRYWLGRHLIHAGLRAMPPGRVRMEIHEVLETWGQHVRDTLAQRQGQ